MTKTINDLKADLREMETIASTMVSINPGILRSMVDSSYRLFSCVVRAELLDLSIKGILPEGSVGRIMTAVDKAMEQSKERVLDDTNAELPSP